MSLLAHRSAPPGGMETPRRVRGSRSLLGRLKGTPGASPAGARDSAGAAEAPRSPRVERERSAPQHRPLLGLLLVAGLLLLLSDFGGLARVQRGGRGEVVAASGAAALAFAVASGSGVQVHVLRRGRGEDVTVWGAVA
jgi:hypothetical protein